MSLDAGDEDELGGSRPLIDCVGLLEEPARTKSVEVRNVRPFLHYRPNQTVGDSSNPFRASHARLVATRPIGSFLRVADYPLEAVSLRKKDQGLIR